MELALLEVRGDNPGRRSSWSKGLEVRNDMGYPKRTSFLVCKGNGKMVVRDEAEEVEERSVWPIKETGHLQRGSRPMQGEDLDLRRLSLALVYAKDFQMNINNVWSRFIGLWPIVRRLVRVPRKLLYTLTPSSLREQFHFSKFVPTHMKSPHPHMCPGHKKENRKIGKLILRSSFIKL